MFDSLAWSGGVVRESHTQAQKNLITPASGQRRAQKQFRGVVRRCVSNVEPLCKRCGETGKCTFLAAPQLAINVSHRHGRRATTRRQ
jgi:hypothetical protein